MLAQPSRHFVRVRSFSLLSGAHFHVARDIKYRHFVRVSSISLWRGAHLRNPPITLCVSDDSRSGAVLILISLAHPPRHFVHYGIALVAAWC